MTIWAPGQQAVLSLYCGVSQIGPGLLLLRKKTWELLISLESIFKLSVLMDICVTRHVTCQVLVNSGWKIL